MQRSSGYSDLKDLATLETSKYSNTMQLQQQCELIAEKRIGMPV